MWDGMRIKGKRMENQLGVNKGMCVAGCVVSGGGCNPKRPKWNRDLGDRITRGSEG